jgi:hypothetical protein
MIERVH